MGLYSGQLLCSFNVPIKGLTPSAQLALRHVAARQLPHATRSTASAELTPDSIADDRQRTIRRTDGRADGVQCVMRSSRGRTADRVITSVRQNDVGLDNLKLLHCWSNSFIYSSSALRLTPANTPSPIYCTIG